MNIPDGVRSLDRDLRTIFGSRLQSLVLFRHAAAVNAGPTPTLAVVDVLTADDLAACAARVGDWHDAGLATPLVVPRNEFGRSLDAFPLEFDAILAEHIVVSGTGPFEELRVEPGDLRRACERRARGHLLHLREGYLETRGRGDAIADLIVRSAAPLAALLRSVARLHGIRADDAASAARHVESAAG